MNYASNRLQGHWRSGGVTSMLNEIGDQAATTIEEYPLAVTLGMFGVGMAVGACLGMVLAETAFAQPTQAETIAQKTLDALAQVLPASVMQKIRS